MTKIVNRKNILITLLVLVLIPLSTGLFCHCCEASQTTETVLKAPPCTHCCTTLKPGEQCEAPSVKKFALAPILSWAHMGFEMVKTAAFFKKPLLQTGEKNLTVFSDFQLSPPHTPVYLAIQVLLI